MVLNSNYVIEKINKLNENPGCQNEDELCALIKKGTISDETLIAAFRDLRLKLGEHMKLDRIQFLFGNGVSIYAGSKNTMGFSEVIVTTIISGIYDDVAKQYSFGTDTYPVVGESCYRLDNSILSKVFQFKSRVKNPSIGTYLYDRNVDVCYNPNVLFGKHLGVFGNTGSGKTCTVVSIIQRYIRDYPDKDIKFVILDVNGEYRTAFNESEAEYVEFSQLRFCHHGLSDTEYGRLFRAAEGVQYPALKSSIEKLQAENEKWDLQQLPSALSKWIDENSRDNFAKNQLSGYLRTMLLRIDGILSDSDLMGVINSPYENETIRRIFESDKKVVILDLQVSSDSLDIVNYLLFKRVYDAKCRERNSTHICLVLEEAHRYINVNTDESKLGSYYIDKLSREGRKFGVGLIISSQVPSLLAYEVISQCNSIVMHKITNRRDLEYLRNVLRISNDTFYLQMSALEKQHAVVSGEAFPNDTIVRINDAYPLPLSSDPIIEDRLLGDGGMTEATIVQ